MSQASIELNIPNFAAPAPGLYTGGRPQPEDFRQAKAQGLQTVINLCPHAEPAGYDESALVQELGMRYVNIPVAGVADPSEANARLLADALQGSGATQPALVHCASSNRVGALFAVKAFRLEGRSVEDALAIGRAAGLRAMEPAVRQLLLS